MTGDRRRPALTIGLDAGTSVVKATAFDVLGSAVVSASRPTATRVPAPGQTEQDLEEVIAAVGAVLHEIVAAIDDAPALLGISGQGDGLWLLDEQGRGVRPAILWSDARAAAIVEGWMSSGMADALFARSLNMPFPGAAGALLLALRRDEPDTLARAATAAYCKDAIVQRLTGARATDISDASLPFMDLQTRHYDPDLLTMIGLDGLERLLAPIDPVPGPLRPLTDDGARLTGLPMGTPVHAGPFDLVATVIGAGLRRPGDGLVTIGTTLACAVLIDRLPEVDPPAGMTLCMPASNCWLRVMPAMVGTPSLEWVLALVGAGREQLDAMLDQTDPGAGGLLALPLFSPAGERAPFVDPAARGQIIGLSLETGRAGVVRAVCEGMAYAARHCLDAAGLAPDGEIVICGGGTRSVAWRQILADVLQRPLHLARQPEVGARGAALAALDASGATVDHEAWTLPDGIVSPRPELGSLYHTGFGRYLDQLERARGHWSGPTLARL